MKEQAVRLAAGILTACIAFGAQGTTAFAKAKSASVPDGVTLTKDGLVTDMDTLTQAMEDAQAGTTDNLSDEEQAVISSVTVLDADDLYYTREDAGTSLIVTAASGSVRFHNTKIGDPRSIVEAKLGTAFTKVYSAPDAGGIDLYQDNEDTSCILWFQFDANDTVTAIVYQKDPSQQ